MDFLSDSFYDSRLEGQGPPYFDGKSLADFERHYTDKEAFDFSLLTYNELKYIDIHASVFTPESFKILFERISALHLLPIVVSDPIKLNHENKNVTDFDRDEFIVRFEKTNQKKLDFTKRQGFENYSKRECESREFYKIKNELNQIYNSKSWLLASAFRNLYAKFKILKLITFK